MQSLASPAIIVPIVPKTFYKYPLSRIFFDNSFIFKHLFFSITWSTSMTT
jgi:hypothetical protein